MKNNPISSITSKFIMDYSNDFYKWFAWHVEAKKPFLPTTAEEWKKRKEMKKL